MKFNKKSILKLSITLGIFAIVLTLDLVTKYIFDAKLADVETLVVIPSLFNFKRVHNYGAAWGSFEGQQVMLIVTTVIFIALFTWFFIQEKNKSWGLNVAYGLILAGCFGNLFDRLFFGYVRDFIQFAFWTDFPVFNFADVALCVGVVIFVICTFIGILRSNKKKKTSNNEGDKNE